MQLRVGVGVILEFALILWFDNGYKCFFVRARSVILNYYVQQKIMQIKQNCIIFEINKIVMGNSFTSTAFLSGFPKIFSYSFFMFSKSISQRLRRMRLSVFSSVPKIGATDS